MNKKINHAIGVLLAVFLLLSTTTVIAAVVVPANPQYAWFAPRASSSLLLAISGHGEQAIWLVGEHGHILKSDSDGPWQQASVPTQILLTAIDMFDTQYGWAVGHDATILKTSDGGVNWHLMYKNINAQSPLFDVLFSSREKGIAVGAYGFYLATNDGGVSWRQKFINEEHDFHLNAISKNAVGELFIAAEAGNLYRSTDTGKHWTSLLSPYDGSFFDVLAWGDKHVAVAGLRGHLYVSADKGESWKKIPSNLETSLNSIIRLKNGQLLVVGHAGMVLLVSADFTEAVSYQLANRKALSDVYEFKANQLLLVGESGVSTFNLCDAFNNKAGGC